MISFSAIAKIYAKKLASPGISHTELEALYKKLYKSMLAVNDIITDREPFAQKERFNLNEVIAERLEAYYFPPLVVIEQNFEGWELQIAADRKKVGRIVGNLIDNAHRKLEEIGKGVLRINLHSDGHHAVIEIGNTGAIPDEVMELFQESCIPLQSATHEGSGQGLNIVKLFTVMHNGTVHIESPPGADFTTFRVKLPLQ